MESAVEILTIFILILFNGFFAGAEIAILTARRHRLEQAAAGGSQGARAALRLADDSAKFLSTVQVGITGVGTLAAAYGGVSLVEQFAERLSRSTWPFVARHGESLALAAVTGAIAFCSLVLGELVPKRFALAYAERLASFVAPPMLALRIVAAPIVAVLGGVTQALLRILGVREQTSPQVSVDDIRHLIEAGASQGVVEPTVQDVALEAFQLRNRRVRDIMRPRIDIDAVDIDTPADEVVGVVAMSGFSRLPIYDGDLDHVVGFVYNKDLFQQHYLGRATDLRRMLRQPLFIPENLPLDRVLVAFQERRTQLAIVLDEFGGTRGMVTFEDVLEELVGEIHDEHRRDDPQRVVRRDDHSWLVDGLTPVHDLLELLPEQARLDDAALDASTVAGVALTALKKLPKIGDKFRSGNVDFEIVDMDGQRIDRVMVSAPQTPSE